MSAPKTVAYYRVSTKGQGVSGLGLDGQREAVRAYTAARKGKIVAEFTEIESGKRDDRPELARAIVRAKRTGARIVVAKLDRLSRDAHFLLGLVKSGVDLAFCDLPEIPEGPMGTFFVGLMAQLAQLEAGLISGRTKTALAAYRAGKHISKRIKKEYPQGVPPEVVAATAGKLGAELPACRNLTTEARRKGCEVSRSVRAAAAHDQAEELGPRVRTMRDAGKSYRDIAKALNDDEFLTRRGKPWTHVAVLRLLNRA